jgi:hypothetical protein
MSHEQFLADIYSRLSTVISADPLLSHIKCHPSKISFSKLNPLEEKPTISISIRRFDDSLINVDVSEEARVFQLKRSIKQTFLNQKLNWKYIWKRYTLATDDQQQLINDNQKLKHYGVKNNSELSFVHRRRLK